MQFKKAEGDVRIGFFITMLIFLFLLFIIVVYLAGPGQETFNRLKLLLPSFMFSTTNEAKSQIIGYSITNDVAKYYDSLNWQDLAANKKITYNKKDISGSNVQQQFFSYFYSSDLRNSIDKKIIFDKNVQDQIEIWYKGANSWTKNMQDLKGTLNGKIILLMQNPDFRGTQNMRGAVNIAIRSYTTSQNQVAQSPPLELSIGPIETLSSTETTYQNSKDYGINKEPVRFIFKDGIKTGVFIRLNDNGIYVFFSDAASRATIVSHYYGTPENVVAVGQLYSQTDKNTILVVSPYGYCTSSDTKNCVNGMWHHDSKGNEGFYSVLDDKDFEILQDISNKYYVEHNPYVYEKILVSSPQNEAQNNNTATEGTENYGQFFLTLNNKLSFQKVDAKLNPEDKNPDNVPQDNIFYTTIAPKSIAWRDSIFSKPMQFLFDGEKNANYFCVKKIQLKNEYYLTIDLSKPVGQGETCTQ